MSTAQSIEAIERAALELQPSARAALAHALVQSIGNLSETDLGDLWLEEARRRDAEMESGVVKGVPGDAVFDRIRSRYGS